MLPGSFSGIIRNGVTEHPDFIEVYIKERFEYRVWFKDGKVVPDCLQNFIMQVREYYE